MAESIEFNLVEFASHVFSRRRVVVSLSLALMLGFVLYVSVVQRSSFRAIGTININMALKSQSLSPSRLTSWIEEQEMLTKVNLTERFFESSDYRRAVLAEVEGKTKYCTGEQCQELKSILSHELNKRRNDEELEKVEYLFSRLAIRADSSRFILNIVGTDRNPRIAHALSTIAIHTLIALNYELLLNKNSRVREFIESQTKVTGDDLAALEISLVEEQKKSNLIATLETETRLTAIHLDYQQRLSTLIRDVRPLNY